MARPSLFTHRKFTKLCRMLGCTYRAVGILEVIWHHAYQDGDPVVGTWEDIEFIVCWDGEPGVCADALVACGFLEDAGNGELAVHDLYDHAPDYVRKRRAREEQRRDKSDCDRSVSGQCRQNGSTPAPAPAPAHKECSNEHSPTPDGFGEFWSVYPKKVQKQAAIKAWKQTKKIRPPTDEIVAKVLALAATEPWTKDGGQFVPYPATWLRAGGWDDEVQAPSKRQTAGRHDGSTPWHVDDVRKHQDHARWDEYMDAMAGKPGPWPRFERWLNE